MHAASCAMKTRLHLYGARATHAVARPPEANEPHSLDIETSCRAPRHDHDGERDCLLSDSCQYLDNRRDTPPRDSFPLRGVAFLAR